MLVQSVNQECVEGDGNLLFLAVVLHKYFLFWPVDSLLWKLISDVSGYLSDRFELPVLFSLFAVFSFKRVVIHHVFELLLWSFWYDKLQLLLLVSLLWVFFLLDSSIERGKRLLYERNVCSLASGKQWKFFLLLVVCFRKVDALFGFIFSGSYWLTIYDIRGCWESYSFGLCFEGHRFWGLLRLFYLLATHRNLENFINKVKIRLIRIFFKLSRIYPLESS